MRSSPLLAALTKQGAVSEGTRLQNRLSSFSLSPLLLGNHRPGLRTVVTASDEEKKRSSSEDGVQREVLYRGPWLQQFRLLVRFKVIQLTGVGALALPLAHYTQHGHLSLGTYLALGCVVGGSAAASAALWYYSRRYIGELSLLLPDRQRVRISTLDFWGNRENTDVALSQLDPPLKGRSLKELAILAQQPLLPLDVVGHRQYIVSLRYGHFIDKEKLLALLTGSFKNTKQAPSISAKPEGGG